MIITKLRDLMNNCGNSYYTCQMTITGGTEYWNHSANTAHKPGGNVLDLRISSLFMDYITGGKAKGVTTPNGSDCAPGVRRFLYRGVLFVDENTTSLDGR